MINFCDTFGYDLWGCLEYNSTDIGLNDIESILALVEGVPDGADFHWVLELKDGRYAYLVGGCDYTGWDCQSYAVATICETKTEAVMKAEDEVLKFSLLRQLMNGCDLTWDQKKELR